MNDAIGMTAPDRARSPRLADLETRDRRAGAVPGPFIEPPSLVERILRSRFVRAYIASTRSRDAAIE